VSGQSNFGVVKLAKKTAAASGSLSVAMDSSSPTSYLTITDNGNSVANALTVTGSADGHILVVKNADAEAVSFGTHSVSAGQANMFVYDGSAWESLSTPSRRRRLDAKTGSIRASASGLYSDRRLKTNVETIKRALAKLAQIRGVSFEYKAPDSAGFQGALPEDGVKNIGVIAQEIEAVLPELVTTDEQGYKAVHYANLAGFLIQVNKEQEIEIFQQIQLNKEQQTKIEKMETTVEKLETTVEKMEATVENMETMMMLVLGVVGVLVLALALAGVALVCVFQKRTATSARGQFNSKSSKASLLI
jgi:hypothetical protein